MYVHSVLPNDWSTRSGLQVHYLAHGRIADFVVDKPMVFYLHVLSMTCSLHALGLGT